MPAPTIAPPDASGRVVDYLRLSVTDRCNERCLYCMPEGYKGWQSREDTLTDDEIVRLVQRRRRLGFSQVPRHRRRAAHSQKHRGFARPHLGGTRRRNPRHFHQRRHARKAGRAPAPGRRVAASTSASMRSTPPSTTASPAATSRACSRALTPPAPRVSGKSN